MEFSTYKKVAFEVNSEGARIEIREKKHWWSKEDVKVYTDKDPDFEDILKKEGISFKYHIE